MASRINAAVTDARQAADHVCIAHLFADDPHLILDERARRPVAHRVAAIHHKGADQHLALARVCHLGVKLKPEDLTIGVGHGRDHALVRPSRHRESGRDRLDVIAVAHPHHVAVALEIGKERPRLGLEHHVRQPVLPRAAPAELPAKVLGQQLHPVANPQNRPATLEPAGIERRRIVAQNRGWPAREDQTHQSVGKDLGCGIGAGSNLAVDPKFPDPPSDQLGVLRTEI